jgi:pimeloyl-ACP methyl ester carboxylesterase
VTAPPVLLVHGFASSFELNWVRNGWTDILQEEGRRVIGVDLLGHGSSPKPTEPDAYKDVEELVQSCRQEFPVIDAIGFSAGADVLLTLLSRYPDSFRRAVLLGIGDNALVDGQDAGPDAGERARQAVTWLVDRAENPAALRAFLARPPRKDRSGRLSRITAHVHVVIGTADFSYPADRLAEAISRCTLTVVPGLDHFGTPGDVRAVQAALDFLGAAEET